MCQGHLVHGFSSCPCPGRVDEILGECAWWLHSELPTAKGTTWLQAPPSPHVLTLTKSWAKCCQGESSQLSAFLYQKLLVPESVAKAIAEGMSFSSFPCTSNQRIKQILQNCSSSSFPLADTQQQGKEGDLPEHGVQIPALAPSPTLFVWVRVFISNYAISLTVQRPFSRASPHNLWLLEPMEKSLWWAMLQGWCNEGTATVPEGHPAQFMPSAKSTCP